MHKDLIIDLQQSMDTFALETVIDSLHNFCKTNNVSLEDAIATYIDVYLSNNEER